MCPRKTQEQKRNETKQNKTTGEREGKACRGAPPLTASQPPHSLRCPPPRLLAHHSHSPAAAPSPTAPRGPVSLLVPALSGPSAVPLPQVPGPWASDPGTATELTLLSLSLPRPRPRLWPPPPPPPLAHPCVPCFVPLCKEFVPETKVDVKVIYVECFCKVEDPNGFRPV